MSIYILKICKTNSRCAYREVGSHEILLLYTRSRTFTIRTLKQVCNQKVLVIDNFSVLNKVETTVAGAGVDVPRAIRRGGTGCDQLRGEARRRAAACCHDDGR